MSRQVFGYSIFLHDASLGVFVIDGPFRRLLPRYTEPLLSLYQKIGLTPNHVTVAGFVCAAGSASLASQGWLLSALALWWVGRLLDGTDGIYARSRGQQTDFGGYLDIVLDMASYGIMVLGLAWYKPELSFLWMLILFLYILCITTALSLGALTAKNGSSESDNRSLTLAAGLAEGGETGMAYSLFLLFPSWMGVLVQVWIAVLITTVVARSLLAWTLLSKVHEDSRAYE